MFLMLDFNLVKCYIGIMKQRTTLQDIANALDITKVTVSRALNKQNGVGEALRKEIEIKAEELNYERSSLHRSGKTYDFAFVTPKKFFLKTENFYTDIYFTLHQLCDQKKYRILLLIIDSDWEKELKLPNSLLDSSISGIFIGGELSKDYLGQISKLNIPTVVIDHYSNISNFIHLTMDNYYLGYKAAYYLMDKGHKNIGFLGQRDISSNVTDRIMGIEKALTENNLKLREEWTIDNYDHKSGLYIMDLELPEYMPSAFIGHCDKAAYFFMEKLKQNGLSVPEDISIMSFDDTETALESSPPLTSLHIDRKNFAHKGFELMEKRIGDGFIDRERIYLNSKLIERESVKDINL